MTPFTKRVWSYCRKLNRLLEDTEANQPRTRRRLGPPCLKEQLRVSATRASRDDHRWYRKDLTTGRCQLPAPWMNLSHMH